MINIARRLPETHCCWMIAALLACQFGTPALADPERDSPDQAATDVSVATCELNIQGSHIEQLTLVDESGSERVIRRPGDTVSLPPGRYRLEHVELEGGWAFRAFGMGTSFSLAPDRPYLLTLGSPLEPRLSVERQGRRFLLNHEVVDAAGRRYKFAGMSTLPEPPRFAVFQRDHQLDSGAFEYG